MFAQYGAEHHHILAMVEAAQRAGRSEREITTIVDRYFGERASRHLGLVEEPSLVRRLITRASLKRAA
ncbi:MAG TPA: hypothetical protein VGO39_12865 [Gaiellaceae bacterium]|nr:hypothetical protein [Gaiellaceae bacterium]